MNTTPLHPETPTSPAATLDSGGRLGAMSCSRSFDSLKDEFDAKLAAMSDQDLIDAFAAMGCAVEISSENAPVMATPTPDLRKP